MKNYDQLYQSTGSCRGFSHSVKPACKLVYKAPGYFCINIYVIIIIIIYLFIYFIKLES